MLPIVKSRLFENSEAVVHRTTHDVVLDRDLLPKRKADGSTYPLGCTRQRWILYTDNPACSRFYGEWSTFTSRKAAIEAANKRDISAPFYS